jgi:hypothetical protein
MNTCIGAAKCVKGALSSGWWVVVFTNYFHLFKNVILEVFPDQPQIDPINTT